MSCVPCSWGSEENIRSLGAGVTGSCLDAGNFCKSNLCSRLLCNLSSPLLYLLNRVSLRISYMYMMYLHHICSVPLQLIPESPIPHLPHNLMSSFLSVLFKPLSLTCDAHTHICEGPSTGIQSPYASQHSSTVISFSSGARLMSPYPTHAGALAGLTLCRQPQLV